MGRAGTFIRQQSGIDGYSAFVPAPLPPDPPLLLDADLQHLHETAVHAVGQLEGVSRTMEADRLLYMYVRKEAVLSSQIEGTQSTLADLLEYEEASALGTPTEDVREVSRYVAALYHGLYRIRSGELPLSLRLIRELHGVLMKEGRGSQQSPGEFRRTQNWIGGSRPGNALFVPPPPPEMTKALDNLEKFLHDQFGPTPPILKAGLAHAQFETIHPFLDGNGRVGRLLISLIFGAEGVLTQPLFYLSLYFKQNRADYYDALQRVRVHGDWEGWTRFYLAGVEAVARQATETTLALRTLFEEDQRALLVLGRAAPSAARVYEHLRQRIVISISRTAEELGLTWPTVSAAVQRLESLGIAREMTGRARDRLYVYERQLKLLNQGTESA